MRQHNIKVEPNLDALRRTIPARCFQSSMMISLGFLARDIFYTAVLFFWASTISGYNSILIRILLWTLYGFLQGLVGTGLWVLAHECGHGAFSPSRRLNNIVGWFLHSALLVPYFSWKITHARHHRFTGHMEKDTAFVPLTDVEYAAQKGCSIHQLKHLTQDTPLTTLITLVGHQIAGWQLYLAFYRTGGKDSTSVPKNSGTKKGTLCHFDPTSRLFFRSQRSLILLSDLGLLIMGVVLYCLGLKKGISNLILIYLVPYLWVHHWLVAITYLHHTHPAIPHYTPTTWSFQKGALGTVDRSFGLIGRHFFHDIIDHHVVHHLFPRIPFYRAAEATAAIIPLLGSAYVDKKQGNFIIQLWKTFRRCRYVSVVIEDEKSGVFEWR